MQFGMTKNEPLKRMRGKPAAYMRENVLVNVIIKEREKTRKYAFAMRSPQYFLLSLKKRGKERHHITCFFMIRGAETNGRISKSYRYFFLRDYFGKNNFNW